MGEKVDKDFVSLFKKNSTYLDQRTPLDKKLSLIEEAKKNILAYFENIEGGIMKEIADIPQPACNHDICLHVKMYDSYFDDVYACVSCGRFLMEPDYLSHIIEIKTEMNEDDLKTLLQILRAIINSKLNYEPNMTIQKVVEIIEDYLGQRIGNIRQ